MRSSMSKLRKGKEARELELLKTSIDALRKALANCRGAPTREEERMRRCQG
jgi:hypothetical protein